MELYKLAYKVKCFDDSTTLRRHSDFKKRMFVCRTMASKPDQSESVVNGWNPNTAWTILQENWPVTCGEIAASTNISKTLVVRILRNNLHVFFQTGPHHYTKEQMQTRILKWYELKQMLQNSPNFPKTVNRWLKFGCIQALRFHSTLRQIATKSFIWRINKPLHIIWRKVFWKRIMYFLL